MNDLRIDYGDLSGLVDEGAKKSEQKKERKARLRSLPLRTARLLLVLAGLAVLPFALLIRGGVFAFQEWGIGTWPALLLAATATSLLLGLYAWGVSRRFGASQNVRKLFTRAAMGVGIAYVAYGLVFVASENVAKGIERGKVRHPGPKRFDYGHVAGRDGAVDVEALLSAIEFL